MRDEGAARLRAAPAFIAAVLLLAGAQASRAAAPESSWIKPKADESLLVDIDRGDGRWLAVGERGHVLLSDDAETWRQVKVPTRVLLTAVAVNEAGLGFAVGHDATIIRTRDNGESWERVYHAPEEQAPLLDVVMPGDERVVAVGAYGLYVESGDDGETWQVRTLEPQELEPAATTEDGEEEFYYDYHLNDIAIAGNGRWYIAAEAGNAYRSDDQGESWIRLPSPYEGSFFGVLPMEAERVLLFGLQGRLFRSRDAGARWQRVETATDATLTSGLRLDGDRALIAGYTGIVLNETVPDGSLRRARLENRPAVEDVYLLDDGSLMTVGKDGIRYWPRDAWKGE